MLVGSDQHWKYHRSDWNVCLTMNSQSSSKPCCPRTKTLADGSLTSSTYWGEVVWTKVGYRKANCSKENNCTMGRVPGNPSAQSGQVPRRNWCTLLASSVLLNSISTQQGRSASRTPASLFGLSVYWRDCRWRRWNKVIHTFQLERH